MNNHPVSFHHAGSEDLQDLLNFHLTQQEVFYFFPSANYPLTLIQLQKQLSERHRSTVMRLDGQLIGFANFYNVENRNIAFIGNVVINPQQRRKGYGGLLLEYMIKLGFDELKLKEVHLSCYNQNTQALLFYQQRGFKPYALEKRQDFNNRPVIMLHLKLKNPR